MATKAGVEKEKEGWVLPCNSRWIRSRLEGLFGKGCPHRLLWINPSDEYDYDASGMQGREVVTGDLSCGYTYFISTPETRYGWGLNSTPVNCLKDLAWVTFEEQANCCGIMVVTRMYVSTPVQRKGIGSWFLELAQEAAINGSYSQLLVTYDASHSGPKQLLAKARDWKVINSFRNSNTDNLVEVAMKSTGDGYYEDDTDDE